MPSCSRCLIDKPEAEYGRRTSRGGRPNGVCRRCKADESNRYWAAMKAADPEGYRLYQRNNQLKVKFGMTLEGYAEMLASQGGRCAICGSTDPGRSRKGNFAVDHDHACCPGQNSCGRCVRGLLCSDCNQGIGFLKDDPKVIESALDYLSTHTARQSDWGLLTSEVPS